MIGVIGTYNSGCAAIEIPILNQAPRRRPGDGLSRQHARLPDRAEPDPAQAERARRPTTRSGKRNYARVVPNDAVQGAGLASFANEQGVKKPFVLIASDDPTSEGQGRTFEGAAGSLGMQIAGVEH